MPNSLHIYKKISTTYPNTSNSWNHLRNKLFLTKKTSTRVTTRIHFFFGIRAILKNCNFVPIIIRTMLKNCNFVNFTQQKRNKKNGIFLFFKKPHCSLFTSSLMLHLFLRNPFLRILRELRR